MLRECWYGYVKAKKKYVFTNTKHSSSLVITPQISVYSTFKYNMIYTNNVIPFRHDRWIAGKKKRRGSELSSRFYPDFMSRFIRLTLSLDDIGLIDP